IRTDALPGMPSVRAEKAAALAIQAELRPEGDHAPPAVAAKRAHASVGIVVPHEEVGPLRSRLEEHQAITAHAELPVAGPGDPAGRKLLLDRLRPVIDEDEIIAGAVVFDKRDVVHGQSSVLVQSYGCSV